MHLYHISPQEFSALRAQPDLISWGFDGPPDPAPGRRLGHQRPPRLDLGPAWDAILGLLTMTPGSPARRALNCIARPNFYRHHTTVQLYTPARVRYGAGALEALRVEELSAVARRFYHSRDRHSNAVPRVRRWVAAIEALPPGPEPAGDAACDTLTVQHLLRLRGFWGAAAAAGDGIISHLSMS